MNNRILIINNHKNELFFKNLNHIESYYKCKRSNIFLRIIRKFNIPIEFLLYGNWKNKLYDYDIVILFDSGYKKYISKYIKRKNKNIKIILWYWNPLCIYNNMLQYDSNIDQIWTYNRFDALQYNLFYSPQFYHKDSIEQKNSEIVDVIFLGEDKGRENELLNIKNSLDKENVSSNFIIVKKRKDIVKYDDYVLMIQNAKCILDFSFILPCGLSLRPLEALFFNKKLITNNPDIKNYDFYNPNNIFIIGQDDFRNIYNFINLPYQQIDKNIINKYNYFSWLKRLGGN